MEPTSTALKDGNHVQADLVGSQNELDIPPEPQLLDNPYSGMCDNDIAYTETRESPPKAFDDTGLDLSITNNRSSPLLSSPSRETSHEPPRVPQNTPNPSRCISPDQENEDQPIPRPDSIMTAWAHADSILSSSPPNFSLSIETTLPRSSSLLFRSSPPLPPRQLFKLKRRQSQIHSEHRQIEKDTQISTPGHPLRQKTKLTSSLPLSVVDDTNSGIVSGDPKAAARVESSNQTADHEYRMPTFGGVNDHEQTLEHEHGTTDHETRSWMRSADGKLVRIPSPRLHQVSADTPVITPPSQHNQPSRAVIAEDTDDQKGDERPSSRAIAAVADLSRKLSAQLDLNKPLPALPSDRSMSFDFSIPPPPPTSPGMSTHEASYPRQPGILRRIFNKAKRNRGAKLARRLGELRKLERMRYMIVTGESEPSSEPDHEPAGPM